MARESLNGDGNQGLPDLSGPRLSQDFSAEAGVKKVLTQVPVRKADRQWFFRVRPGATGRWRVASLWIIAPCLLKPQFCILLLAPLLRRRQWTTAAWYAGCFVSLLAVLLVYDSGLVTGYLSPPARTGLRHTGGIQPVTMDRIVRRAPSRWHRRPPCFDQLGACWLCGACIVLYAM